jgi:hypothetical protein
MLPPFLLLLLLRGQRLALGEDERRSSHRLRHAHAQWRGREDGAKNKNSVFRTDHGHFPYIEIIVGYCWRHLVKNGHCDFFTAWPRLCTKRLARNMNMSHTVHEPTINKMTGQNVPAKLAPSLQVFTLC